MFLAGYSAALGYYSLLPQGLQAFARKGSRAGANDPCCYHMALVVIIMTAAYVLDLGRCQNRITRSLSTRSKASRCKRSPACPLLAFQAPLLDILPMYIVVMLLAPSLYGFARNSELALLSASGMMWMFAARFFPAIPTVTYDVNWFFNPFCWQFLFAIGLIFGWRTRTQHAACRGGRVRAASSIFAVRFS